MNYQGMLFMALKSAIDAGQAILDIYKTDFDVEKKADESPLTLADKRSHRIITDGLIPFGIPVLSEEGKEIDYEIRRKWEKLWIVDPLDGTKEFIKRNDEFTVNIALVEKQQPVFGVVFLPVKDILYFAENQIGAYRLENATDSINTFKNRIDSENNDYIVSLKQKSTPLPLENISSDVFTIVGSRSHAGRELKNFVAQKEKELGKIQFISAGSSLKICLVAEGRADIYPRLGPTMEWDTAAGQAVAQIAGAEMVEYETGRVMKYNKKNLLNPNFIVQKKRSDEKLQEP